MIESWIGVVMGMFVLAIAANICGNDCSGEWTIVIAGT
jgi:hypothetical protein